MSDFQNFCNRFSPLEKEAADELFKDVKTKTFKKGDYIEIVAREKRGRK